MRTPSALLRNSQNNITQRTSSETESIVDLSAFHIILQKCRHADAKTYRETSHYACALTDISSEVSGKEFKENF